MWNLNKITEGILKGMTKRTAARIFSRITEN